MISVEVMCFKVTCQIILITFSQAITTQVICYVLFCQKSYPLLLTFYHLSLCVLRSLCSLAVLLHMSVCICSSLSYWDVREDHVIVDLIILNLYVARTRGVTVKCILCLDDNKCLSVAKNSTSDIKKYLQTEHSTITSVMPLKPQLQNSPG